MENKNKCMEKKCVNWDNERKECDFYTLEYGGDMCLRNKMLIDLFEMVKK